MENDQHKYYSRALLLNPVVIILYAVACYYIAGLAEYGGISRRVPIILFTMGVLIIWFLWSFFRTTPKTSKSTLNKLAKPWYHFALVAVISMTSITVYDVYQSSINYQGKLSWVIQDLIHNRKVSFEKNNIYEYGIEGLLQDIDEQLSLPEELYVSDEFSLSFNEEGVITSIYSSLYGENDEGEIETFSMTYDADDDERITVRADVAEYAPNSSEEMSLEPLIHAMGTLPLRDIVSDEWYGETFDVFNIYYIGERDWGHDTDGLIYFNDEEILGSPEMTYNEMSGYTVSIYPEHISYVVPKRYVYTDEENLDAVLDAQSDLLPPDELPFEVAEEYYLNEDIGYQLVVLDAALGSRYYGLTKTTDGGTNWEMLNVSPFNNSSGGATGVTFINEDLGFAGLSHSGGIYADLYKTTDGGENFEIVKLPDVMVPLSSTKDYNPFDFPEMPYEEGGKLVLYVNQGADGDYNRGVRAIYHSYDHGETWEFIEEE